MKEHENISPNNLLKKGDLFSSNNKTFIVIGKGFPVSENIQSKKLPLNEIDIKIIELIKNCEDFKNETVDNHHDDPHDEQIHICNDDVCDELDREILAYIDETLSMIDLETEKNKKQWHREYLLGFYKPYHYDYDKYGIYLKANGQALRVNRIFEKAKEDTRRFGNPSIEGCYLISKTFTFFHEYYHHKIETFATRLEIVTRQDHYTTGFHCLYCKTFMTDRCLEEAFAESYAYFETIKELAPILELLNITRRQLKCILRDLIIANSPPGYNKALKIIAAESPEVFKKYENYFLEALLRYSYKVNNREYPVELNPVFWKHFTHATHPFILTNNDVTYVVEADEKTITKWRNFFNV